MSERLFYSFKELSIAQHFVNNLLLKKIDTHHIHCLAKEGVDLKDLPEATLFQKKDLGHSVIVGLGLGAVLGVAMGIYAHKILDIPFSGLMIATTLIGAIFGAWSASMVGMMAPNPQLKPYNNAIEQGEILVIVDVPNELSKDVEKLAATLVGGGKQ